MNRRAIISPCGLYRYSLSREKGSLLGSKGAVLFILNNPSTADDKVDDQTVRKCWGYVRRWGYSKMIFVNTNPYRSTNPFSAIMPPEETLFINDECIRRAAEEAVLIICAWGLSARSVLTERAVKVVGEVGKTLHVLELSQEGIPKHPLYLKGDLQPIVYRHH